MSDRLPGIVVRYWGALAPNSPAYARFAQTQKDQIVGQLVGLPGPIAGIMIAGYWIVRRTRLNFADLYDAQGEYRHASGWNPVALIAFAVPVAINLPGFLHSAFPEDFAGVGPLWVRLHDWAWFIGVIIALGIYTTLTKRTQQGSVPLQPWSCPGRAGAVKGIESVQ